MRAAAAGVILAVAAWGQGGVSGVRSGVVFDAPAGAVRVVEGVAGAAHLGAAVLDGVERAWVAPTGRAAVVRGSGGWALVKGIGGEEREERELAYEVEGAKWSAGGRYVALAGGERIEVWDVEGMERVEWVDQGEGREAAWIGVSDAGGLAVAWFDGEATALEVWRDGQWQELGRVSGRGVGAIAGGRVALAGAGEVVCFEGDREAWRAAVEGRGAPVGVEIVGKELLAAYAGDEPALLVWAVTGGEAKAVALEAAPERLERMGGGEALVLRLREREGEEIWVAARRQGEWRAYFVPAGEVK